MELSFGHVRPEVWWHFKRRLALEVSNSEKRTGPKGPVKEMSAEREVGTTSGWGEGGHTEYTGVGRYPDLSLTPHG